jgi:hypothetical protein
VVPIGRAGVTPRALPWLSIVALLAPAPALAQSSREAAIKSEYLVKFGAYVAWPPGTGPVKLCVVGRDVLGRSLAAAAAGRSIAARPLVIERVDAVSGQSDCAIAFIVGSARQSVPAALEALRSLPVLTVTDSRWNKARGMIHFQIAAGRVRFHIDDRAAGESGLGISSKLLGLALTVRPRER